MFHQKIELGIQDGWLETYFIDESDRMINSHIHPCVVIAPGGGYEFCCDREAEPIALSFAQKGIHSVVVRYPCAPTRFPVQLVTMAKAVAWVRAHADELHVDKNDISICGFSAGGHLTASLGVFWNEPFLAKAAGLTPEEMRPNKMILGYPVITSGEFAHRGSIDNLLGADADKESVDFQALETHVSRDTPATFLWHTCNDELVPVENSLMFSAALQKCGVPFEMHIYSKGQHGLALATELTADQDGQCVAPWCAGWIDLACDWLTRK